jgi:hypothetical protein
MTDNELLVQINETLFSILNAVNGDYTSVSGGQIPLIVDSPTVLRGNEPRAVKVVVTNFGPAGVEVMEGNHTVAILGPNESWVSPLKGTDAISAKASPEDATVWIATYIR